MSENALIIVHEVEICDFTEDMQDQVIHAAAAADTLHICLLCTRHVKDDGYISSVAYPVDEIPEEDCNICDQSFTKWMS